jgi:hypothetical protein
MNTRIPFAIRPAKICAWLILLALPTSAQILPVPEVFQEQTNWCWAGTSQAVLQYYGDFDTRQCDIANFARINNGWGNADCCFPPQASGSICNQANNIITGAGSIRNILIDWGITNTAYYRELTQAEIETAIGERRPFIMRFGWTTGGGHFIVGRGIDGNIVHFMDPAVGDGYGAANYNWMVISLDHEWTHTLEMTTAVAPASSDCVVLLVDRTGSMSAPVNIAGSSAATRIEYAREKAAEDAEFIFDPASGLTAPQVAVMFFSTTSQGRVTLIQNFTSTKADVLDAIADIPGADGNTPLAEAMCIGADVLATAVTPLSLRLYVYTDGGENSSAVDPNSPVCEPCFDHPFAWNAYCDPFDCTPLSSATCTDFQCVLAEQLEGNQIVNVRYFGTGIINKNAAITEYESRDILVSNEDNAYGTAGMKASNNPPDVDFLKAVALNSGGWFKHMNDEYKPTITIEKIEDALQGHFQEVSITIELGILEMGGFDFLIAYDNSAAAFIEAEPGQLLEDCGWEYFTYRYGVEGNCGDACPSGLLRIVALAETSNGPNHPSCYGPPDTDPHELARLKFYVSNDRTLDCEYIPIYFFWDDCNDNAVSSVDGEILYIDRAIYDFEGNLVWDEENDAEFPEDIRIPFLGAPDYCLNPDPEKPSAVRMLDFVFGGIDIICSDSIDIRGDINCNGVPYEIADATMFVNYFIHGLSAFDDHVEASIAASDCNADGMPLSIADLVYMIRVIIGDASPYPKPVPHGSEATVSMLINHTAASIAIDCPVNIGAARFVIAHSGYEIGPPHLINGASDMSLKYSNENGYLKVLIYSFEQHARIDAGTHHIFSIPIDREGSMTLVDVEMSDYFGNVIKTTIDGAPEVPNTFALHQNYPNPFNASTTIMYELPLLGHVRIEVYNILGQKVVTLADCVEPAGIHRVTWNGLDESGSTVPSGVYFYRMTTSDFSAKKKMILLK